jgi:hypothetical protein
MVQIKLENLIQDLGCSRLLSVALLYTVYGYFLGQPIESIEMLIHRTLDLSNFKRTTIHVIFYDGCIGNRSKSEIMGI